MAGLTDEENKILGLKYASAPFGRLSDFDRLTACKIALVKIGVITGWHNPHDEALAILVDQFSKRMVEGYPTVNLEELEYAFRTYGVSVKDWGKQVNLSLIDEVLRPYLESRLHVSRVEEQKKSAAALPDPQEPESDKTYEDWMEHVRERVKALKCTVDFIPVALYDWMDKKGEIKATGPEKLEYLEKAVSLTLTRLTTKADLGDTEAREQSKALFEMKANRRLVGPVAEQMKNLAKKLILYDLLMKGVE